MQKSDISLVLVASHESEVLKMCLDSYFRNSKLENELIIVVDDPSWQVVKVLQDYNLDYTLTQVHHFFRNMNIGGEKATRKYVGFVSADIIFGPSWDVLLQKYIDFLGKEWALISSNLLDSNRGFSFGYNHTGNIDLFDVKQFEAYVTNALARREIGGWFWMPLLIPIHLFKKYGGFTTFSTQGHGHECVLENILKDKEHLTVRTVMASMLFHFGHGHRNEGRHVNLWGCSRYFKCYLCGKELIITDPLQDIENDEIANRLKRGERWVCPKCENRG